MGFTTMNDLYLHQVTVLLIKKGNCDLNRGLIRYVESYTEIDINSTHLCIITIMPRATGDPLLAVSGGASLFDSPILSPEIHGCVESLSLTDIQERVCEHMRN